MRIAKQFTFEAAHQLPYHQGKCRNLHGHSYRVEVVVVGRAFDIPNQSMTGMVMDFSEVSDFWRIVLEPKLDHKFLNESTGLETPTAELIAAFITAHMVKLEFPVESVTVWETDTSWAQACPSDPEVIELCKNIP